MKQLYLFAIILFALVIYSACKSSTTEKENLEGAESQTYIHKFKVVNLSDSIVADSIWKLIFTVESIEQLSLSREDSLVIIKSTSPEKTALKNRIINRGGIVSE